MVTLLRDYVYSLYHYSAEIIPYFLVAVVITSLLQGYTDMGWLRGIVKREKTAPLYTGLMAGVLPLCSCSMLPMANLINSLSRSYAPVLSFLIIAPVISPVTLILTYGYFGLSMTLLRLVGTFVFALAFAYLAGHLFRKHMSLPLYSGQAKGSSVSGSFMVYLRENTLGIGKYLVIGIFIAAAIKTFVPQNLIAPLAGSIFSYPIISFLSVPVYVCSGEEVPIAKALKEIGFTGGNSLTFMLGGSGLCIPTILATLKFLPPKLVFSYFTFWVFFSILMGMLYDFVFWNFLV